MANLSQLQDIFLINTLFISNILCFTTERTIKKLEGFSVAPDLWLMKSWGKKEINITIKGNSTQLLTTMREHYLSLDGWNTTKI